MNVPLIIFGSIGSVLLILLVITALDRGIKEAAILLAVVCALFGAISLILAFWFWVGGAFA